MNKIVENALANARKILKSNTLSETARQLFDEFVAAVDALAEDAAEHNETSIKDEFEKVPAGIANKVEADKDAIIKDFSEHVQAKGSLKESSLTSEEQQRYNKIINEVAKYVKSEIEKL